MWVCTELSSSCVPALNKQLRDKTFFLTQDSACVCQKCAEIFPTTASSSLFNSLSVREGTKGTDQAIKCSNINIPSFHAEQRSQMADILPRVQTSGFHSKVNFEVVTPFKFKLLLRVIWTQQQYLLYLQGIKCILQPVASRKFCVLSYSGLLPLGM